MMRARDQLHEFACSGASASWPNIREPTATCGIPGVPENFLIFASKRRRLSWAMRNTLVARQFALVAGFINIERE